MTAPIWATYATTDPQPPCAHCGSMCVRNIHGDWICAGDENCFLNAYGLAVCANCGKEFGEHYIPDPDEPWFPLCHMEGESRFAPVTV